MLDLFTEIKARLHLVSYRFGNGLTIINLRLMTAFTYRRLSRPESLAGRTRSSHIDGCRMWLTIAIN